MPLKSQAQRRFLHAKHPSIAKRFESETPKGARLPERVSGRGRIQQMFSDKRKGK